MSNKLKPCPFCGSDDVVLYSESALCQSCLAEGPCAAYEERAARLWNERAGDVNQPEQQYPTYIADGSKLFVIENGEVKEYSLGEDWKRLFGDNEVTGTVHDVNN